MYSIPHINIMKARNTIKVTQLGSVLNTKHSIRDETEGAQFTNLINNFNTQYHIREVHLNAINHLIYIQCIVVYCVHEN